MMLEYKLESITVHLLSNNSFVDMLAGLYFIVEKFVLLYHLNKGE